MKLFSIIVSLTIGFVSICHIHQIYAAEEQNQSMPNNVAAAVAYYTYHQFKSKQTIPHATTAQKQVVIFDIDGVLLQTDKIKAFTHIGIWNVLRFMAFKQKLPSQGILFDILEHGNDLAHSTQPAYNRGRRIPQLMVDWQLGVRPLSEIEASMKQALERSQADTTTQIIVHKIIELLVEPSLIVATRKPIKDGVKMLHELKEQGYKVYAFSNWDPDSFDLMKKHFPEIFKHENGEMFDGIMISGREQCLKPDVEFFDRFFERFNIKKADAIFFDDTIENVHASNAYGLDAMHCNPKKMQDARTNLLNRL